MRTGSKAFYERVAAFAETLPEDQREEFAALIRRLAIGDPFKLHAEGARRWLSDAGWLR